MDNVIIVPATVYLVFVWKTLAVSQGVKMTDLPVSFENVSFECGSVLQHDCTTTLRCSIHPVEGNFVVYEKTTLNAKGRINCNKQVSKELLSQENANFVFDSNEPKKYLQSDDIYKESRIRGYNFGREFKSLLSIDMAGQNGMIQWKNNWATFLDSIFQVPLSAKSTMCSGCYIPVRMRALKIQPEGLYKCPSFNTGKIPFNNEEYGSKTSTPGVELHELEFRNIQRQVHNRHLLTCMYAFTPYTNMFMQTRSKEKDKTKWMNSAVLALVDIFLENIATENLRICNCCVNKEVPVQNLLNQKFTSQSRYRVQILNSTFANKKASQAIIPSSDVANLIILDDINIFPKTTEYFQNSWHLFIQRSANSTQLKACFQALNLHMVAKWTFENCSILLLKKIVSNTCLNPVGISIDCPTSQWLPHLQSAVKNCRAHSRVYVYSQQSHTSGIIGLVKCLRREKGLELLRCICDPECNLLLNFNDPNSKLMDIFKKDLVMNIYKNGIMGWYRHVPICPDSLNRQMKHVRNSNVTALKSADLSSLCWMEATLKSYGKSNITSGSQICNVSFASLNFRDILLATGKIPVTLNDKSSKLGYHLGMEFSGTKENGEEIMGVTLKPALATTILLGPDAITWRLPKWLSLEEAATIPLVYLTAYYGLCMQGNLKPGKSVLIHSGTGGVGQAAINIALSMNCEVYTTVGGMKKQKYLQRLFPNIPPNHIGNSRDSNFEDMICKQTRGQGVDIVLNSLIEEKLISGLRCIAPRGKFIEIGKHDIHQNTCVGLGNFKNYVNFIVADPMQVITANTQEMDCMRQLVQNGLNSSIVKPLRPTVFCKSKIEEAFRFMSSGKHVGKVLIKLQCDSYTKRSPKLVAVNAMSRTYFSPKKIYIILGGLSGLGLEVANWMALKGAKHLALLSRSKINNGYQRLCIKRLETFGVQVDIFRTDLSSYQNAHVFFETITNSGKCVGGFFNSALVLCDAVLANQTAQTFKSVALAKTLVTRTIDRLSRKYCHDMDYFVTFSSLAASIGNPGQSNYGKANSSMEQICFGRKEDGFHAVAVQWGLIGDVGYVAENMTVKNEFKDGIPQGIKSCLEVLDSFLVRSKSTPIVCFSSIMASDSLDKKTVSNEMTLLNLIKLCSNQEQFEDINPSSTLTDLGIDSLSITALHRHIEREYDLQLSNAKIRDLTWEELNSFLNNGRNTARKDKRNK